ncbi:MAG: hypothetical protein ACLSB9_20765 [Hydrogeniiclostridium mannosilyticum]
MDAVVSATAPAGLAALTVFTGIGTGNNTDDNVGLNRLCDDGLMETLVRPTWPTVPKSDVWWENRLAAYVLLWVWWHICCGPLPVSNPACSPMWDWSGTTQDACRANGGARAQGRTVVERMNVD